MVNKIYAVEWLKKAYYDLDSANILSKSGHYTDTIGYLYHQSIEKLFKSIIAYQNDFIKKTDNLIELNEMINDYFDFNEDELILLGKITIYCTKQRYPSLDKKLPSKNEIKATKEFSIYLFEKVCSIIDIDHNEVKC